ncbi:hypothetical protein OG361_05800 [Streptomyces sp. NBC_00090]|uniref:hypothetical protein n=1 Tax=Streptomyces sp. NBC_00090 TaxID=2903619 RepID=UPI00324E25E6
MTGTSGGTVLVTAVYNNDYIPGGFTWGTYAERLQAVGVSWKTYQALMFCLGLSLTVGDFGRVIRSRSPRSSGWSVRSSSFP